MPQRVKDGRADAAAAEQRLEGSQVTIRLLLHVADGLGARVPGEHRELALVDPLGAELAGMVDPHDAVDQGIVVEVARQPPRALGPAAAIGFAGHARLSLARCRSLATAPRPTAARPAARIAFQPAMEIPRTANATPSQRTIGWPMICAFSAARSSPEAEIGRAHV